MRRICFSEKCKNFFYEETILVEADNFFTKKVKKNPFPLSISFFLLFVSLLSFLLDDMYAFLVIRS